MKKTIKLGVINDEIDDNIDNAISYLKEVKIDHLDIRSIQGTNVIDLPGELLTKIRQKLDKAKITVGMLDTPLFKWYEGNAAYPNKFITEFDLHHFNPLIPVEKKHEYIKKSLKAAYILNAKRVRIFSLISKNVKNMSFFHSEKHLYDFLYTSAKQSNIEVYLENESMCNISSPESISQFLTLYGNEKDHPLLLDIGSIYFAGNVLKVDKLREWIPKLGYFHLKDYSRKEAKYVTIGKGSIPYVDFIPLITNSPSANLFLIFETHTNKNLKALSESIRYISSLLN